MDWNKRVINTSMGNIKKPKKKIKIAILDSGVDWGNDIELKETVSLVPGEENMNPLFMDGTGHGNSVAGLIAAEDNKEGITGINPEAEIYSIRVLDDNNQAPVSRVIKGIYYAIDKKVNIINMSFGMKNESLALKQAIQDASKAGILIVAAAGNTGNEVEYPAAYEDVISVGSVDAGARISQSSAKGKHVDIVAPGEKVCSTGEFGDILISSGTSLSSPQVAAAVSIIWQKDISMPKEFVRDLIIESGNHSVSKDYGVLDINYALEHYDEVKRNYKINSSIELVNKEEIKKANNSGCVKGSWSVDSHVIM